MRLVPINSVREGYYLAKTLYGSDNRVLLRQGTALNDSLIKGIRDCGIEKIYITDEFSNNEIEDILKPEIRQKAVKSVKDTFENFQKANKQANSGAGNYKERLQAKMREEQMEAISEASKSIVDEVLSSRNTMVSLVDIKSADSYTYEHSVSVATLSLILGMELGLNVKQLNELCAGALLHDIGKAFIPKEILNSKEKLTPEQYATVKEHTTKGYEYIKEDRYIPAVVKVIVLQHHERLDGAGYPRGLNGEHIHNFTRIVSITNKYDSLISDRPFRKAVSPNEALEYIMGNCSSWFDLEMARTFVRKIIPYPVGTLVKLSNGDVGVVEEVQPNFPLRPKVKVIRQNTVNIQIENVDLMKENNLVIKGIQYDAPNLSTPHNLKNT